MERFSPYGRPSSSSAMDMRDSGEVTFTINAKKIGNISISNVEGQVVFVRKFLPGENNMGAPMDVYTIDTLKAFLAEQAKLRNRANKLVADSGKSTQFLTAADVDCYVHFNGKPGANDVRFSVIENPAALIGDVPKAKQEALETRLQDAGSFADKLLMVCSSPLLVAKYFTPMGICLSASHSDGGGHIIMEVKEFRDARINGMMFDKDTITNKRLRVGNMLGVHFDVENPTNDKYTIVPRFVFRDFMQIDDKNQPASDYHFVLGRVTHMPQYFRDRGFGGFNVNVTPHPALQLAC
jgi:hypothetical protein